MKSKRGRKRKDECERENASSLKSLHPLQCLCLLHPHAPSRTLMLLMSSSPSPGVCDRSEQTAPLGSGYDSVTTHTPFSAVLHPVHPMPEQLKHKPGAYCTFNSTDSHDCVLLRGAAWKSSSTLKCLSQLLSRHREKKPVFI